MEVYGALDLIASVTKFPVTPATTPKENATALDLIKYQKLNDLNFLTSSVYLEEF